MTLHVFTDVEQGSDEWHDQRRGIVTASVVGRLLTATGKPADNLESRNLTLLLAAERITGHTDPTYMNDDMLRGHEDEPRALEVYAANFPGAVIKVGFMVEDRWGFPIGYSPDGVVGVSGLIEVKSRRQKKQLATVLADEVPPENMAQIQCGLLVSGRKWLDYVSYSGGMALYRKRVFPDLDWQNAIVTAVERFEQAATQMVADYHSAVTGMPMTERVDNDLELKL